MFHADLVTKELESFNYEEFGHEFVGNILLEQIQSTKVFIIGNMTASESLEIGLTAKNAFAGISG